MNPYPSPPSSDLPKHLAELRRKIFRHPGDREVAILYAVQRMTVRQIACLIGVTYQAIHARIQRICRRVVKHGGNAHPFRRKRGRRPTCGRAFTRLTRSELAEVSRALGQPVRRCPPLSRARVRAIARREREAKRGVVEEWRAPPGRMDAPITRPRVAG